MNENIKNAGLFLIKTLVFSVVFWIVWSGVSRPQPNARTTDISYCNQTQGVAQDAAMKKYMEQAATVEVQQKRMDSILAKQEQQSSRFDAILSTWEKQAKK